MKKIEWNPMERLVKEFKRAKLNEILAEISTDDRERARTITRGWTNEGLNPGIISDDKVSEIYDLCSRTIQTRRNELEDTLASLTRESFNLWGAIFKEGCSNSMLTRGITFAQELKAKEALARPLSSEEMVKTGDAQ